tara:strand:+ start:372 stop:593 length:222 start_codon:yes stop_codon:yes gene_type:complete
MQQCRQNHPHVFPCPRVKHPWLLLLKPFRLLSGKGVIAFFLVILKISSIATKAKGFREFIFSEVLAKSDFFDG